jgi:parallel beta-helix repeat protein
MIYIYILSQSVWRTLSRSIASILFLVVSVPTLACSSYIASDSDLVTLGNTIAHMPAGSTVCINSGTYYQQLTVFMANGTAAAPINIVPTSPQNPPQLTQGILVRGSAYIHLNGMHVTNPLAALAGIVIDQGSHDIQVTGMTVQNAQAGIAIGTTAWGGLGGPAGANNLISGNAVSQSQRTGIGIANLSDGSPGRLNRITGNTVTNSGGHGIDVDNTSYVQIDHNVVANSGLGVGIQPAGGYSGIHLYAPADVPGRCTQNIVRYNKVYGTQERSALTTAYGDGNGIQVDHFCDVNEVSFNVIWNNAGSGINIYIAKQNKIFSNTARGNLLQEGRISKYPPQWNPVGEITLSTAPMYNGQNTQGRTNQNLVYDNIVDAVTTDSANGTVYGAPGINVDYWAAPYGNIVGPNMAHGSAGSSGRIAVYYNSVAYTAGAAVDSATGTVGNLVAKPKYVDPASPLTDGLQLKALPTACGVRVAPNMADILAVWPQSNSCNFGAYYKN